MKILIRVAILLLFLPASAQSQVNLGAACEGDSIRIWIQVINSWLEESPEEHGIAVFAEYVGTCEDPWRIDPAPFPMPPYLTMVSYSFAIPNPDTDRYLFYQSMGVDPDGEFYPVYGGGDLNAWDFAGCENAVMVRGDIRQRPDIGGYAIEPCPGSCWSTTYGDCPIDFTQTEPGWEEFADTGLILDFYGETYTIGMPGAPCAFISRVEPVTDPAGCNAVPNEPLTWGSLKATYR